MADNTRLKELAKSQAETQAQLERFEAANNARFEKSELFQKEAQTQFSRINAALEKLLLQTSTQQSTSQSQTTQSSTTQTQTTTPPPLSHHGIPNSPRNPFQMKNIKLEFPRFDGKNVMEWIFKAEQFFDYYQTPDPERLTVASVHLDLEIVPWFQMLQRSQPFQSWKAFTRALELDFGPSIYDCPRATLFKLAQTGTVTDYYMAFTAVANRVYGLSNDAVVDCFVSGLQADIRREVMIHGPISIVKAFSLAKVYEEKYTEQTQQHDPTKTSKLTNQAQSSQTLTRAHFNPKTTNPNQQKPNTNPILATPPTRPMHPNQKNPNIKRITPAEMQLRKDKGLCYFCDDKWSFSHKCPNKQLMLLQIDEEPESETITDPPDPPPTETDSTFHHLSLNAMKGAHSLGTIRFRGHIGNISVQILVDGGSSDNFLQPRLAQFLKLPVEETRMMLTCRWEHLG